MQSAAVSAAFCFLQNANRACFAIFALDPCLRIRRKLAIKENNRRYVRLSKAPIASPRRSRRKSSSATVSAPSNPLLVDLITELAALLLAAGVGSAEFEQASKLAFVAAASRIARLGNARVNKSAVAAMTGLSRAEVKKLSDSAGEQAPSTKSRQRALRVVDGWQVDAEFLGDDGAPKKLTLQPEAGDFGVLVRRYSGDIPPRAILRELQRLDLVDVEAGAVTLRRPSTDGKALRQLETLSAVLVPMLAKVASKGRTSGGRLVGRELTLSVPDLKAHRLLHKQLNDAIRSFFLNLQNAADGASLPRTKNQATDRETYISVLISD